MWKIILGFLLIPAFAKSGRSGRALGGLIYLASGFWLDFNITPRGNLEMFVCVVFTFAGLFLLGSAGDKF